MSLVTQLTNLVTRIGTEIKSMKSQYSGNNTGSLTGLNTTTKSSLLAAVNEVNTLASGKQANLGFTPENAANKGISNGYAGLDTDGLVPIAQLPAVLNRNKGFFATPTALNTAYSSGSDGDYAIVGSTDTVWVWDGDTSAWVETDKKGQVQSVNGQTGVVVIPAVTTSIDGLMSAADKTSLNNHLSVHPAPTTRDARNQVAGSYEPAFTKNTAFNDNYGTATGTVCQGNDSRLSDARTPVAHNQTASTITDFAASVIATVLTGLSTATNTVISAADTVLSALGKLQKQVSDNLTSFNSHVSNHPAPTNRDTRNQVAGSYETAFTKNTAFNKNFGSAAGDVCQGNDNRLSDARTPVAHTHPSSAITDFAASVIATVLTGLSTATNAVILTTDSVVSAFGKLQKQISDNLSSFNSHTTSHPAPTVRDARNQVAGSYETAFTKNTAFNKNFGSAAGDVCQGNDSRLSDARTPTAHTHVAANITDFATAVGALSFTEAEIGDITTDFVAAFNTAIA